MLLIRGTAPDFGIERPCSYAPSGIQGVWRKFLLSVGSPFYYTAGMSAQQRNGGIAVVVVAVVAASTIGYIVKNSNPAVADAQSHLVSGEAVDLRPRVVQLLGAGTSMPPEIILERSSYPVAVWAEVAVEVGGQRREVTEFPSDVVFSVVDENGRPVSANRIAVDGRLFVAIPKGFSNPPKQLMLVAQRKIEGEPLLPIEEFELPTPEPSDPVFTEASSDPSLKVQATVTTEDSGYGAQLAVSPELEGPYRVTLLGLDHVRPTRPIRVGNSASVEAPSATFTIPHSRSLRWIEVEIEKMEVASYEREISIEGAEIRSYHDQPFLLLQPQTFELTPEASLQVSAPDLPSPRKGSTQRKEVRMLFHFKGLLSSVRAEVDPTALNQAGLKLTTLVTFETKAEPNFPDVPQQLPSGSGFRTGKLAPIPLLLQMKVLEPGEKWRMVVPVTHSSNKAAGVEPTMRTRAAPTLTPR
jgi:hypothetical protein